MKIWALALLPLLAACASEPREDLRAGSGSSAPASRAAGDRAAAEAQKMVGKRYRFGGSSPVGFDCSGLVMYSYRQAGVSLPHNTEQQRRIAKHIKLSELKRGDLLFFDQEGKKNSHVGIYLGNGQFVHAPSSGKWVRTDRLDGAYWKKHLSEARRLAV